jgi:hypothetical protein
MRFVRVAALAATASLTLLTTTAYAAPSCWYPNEAKAAQLRDFHAMLMVGTLQCRTSNKFAIERYNDFVATQRGLLDANSSILKAHFLREHGIQDGQGAYDRYATSLANNQSAKADDPGFCSTIDTFIRMATAASQPDLLILAQSISPAPASGPCSPTNYAATESATPAGTATATVAATAEPAAAVASAAAPAPELEVKTAATETAAGAVVIPAVAAAPEAAKTEDAKAATAAAPAVSREDALQAAVVALQSAAAALQAASASTPAADPAPPAKSVQTVAAVKVEDAPIVPPKEETKP